jgi:hypothetical protein
LFACSPFKALLRKAEKQRAKERDDQLYSIQQTDNNNIVLHFSDFSHAAN